MKEYTDAENAAVIAGLQAEVAEMLKPKIAEPVILGWKRYVIGILI